MRAVRCTTLAIALVASIRASADVKPEEAARAAALFEQGQAAIAANKIDAACVSFDTSLRLDPQIGTRLNLADCRERQGRLVEAHALFVEAADEATRTNKPGRAAFARDRVAALRMKLVRVVLHVATPDLPGLKIALGGRELATAEWAKPQIVAPGPIALAASAPGYGPVHADSAGTMGGEVEITVPALLPIETHDTPAPSKLPWIVGGTGAALVAASLGIGIHTKLRYDDAKSNGDAAGVDRALHEADIATGVAIAGAVAIAVGAVLYVRGGDRDRVAITPGPGSFGIAIQLTTP